MKCAAREGRGGGADLKIDSGQHPLGFFTLSL